MRRAQPFFYAGGMRGGLAKSEAAVPGAQPSGVLPAPGGGRSPEELGDRLVDASGSYGNLEWTLGYAGFLAYMGVITTYALPLGDLAIGAALLGIFLQRQSLRVPRPLILFGVFLGWMALGYSQSRYPSIVQGQLVNFAKLGLVLLVAFNVLRSRSQLRFFIVFWLGCYAVYPLRGAYVNYFLTGYTMSDRALWSFIYANPNDLAALTLLQLSMGVGILVTEKGWFKRAALVGVFLMTLLIFLTQSRAGILGLTAFGVFALAGYRNRLRSLALGALLVIVIVMLAPPAVWDRIGGLTRATNTENLTTLDEEGSAEQRWLIWRTAFGIIDDHRLTGVGWGAYEQANASYAAATGGSGRLLGARDSHSTYLTVLAETGYPGLLLFLALVCGTALQLGGIRRRYKTVLPKAATQLYFLEVGLFAFLVSGIFGSYQRVTFLYVHLALMWALAKELESDAGALQESPHSNDPVRRSTVD